jgi:hypothetical protein
MKHNSIAEFPECNTNNAGRRSETAISMDKLQSCGSNLKTGSFGIRITSIACFNKFKIPDSNFQYRLSGEEAGPAGLNAK